MILSRKCIASALLYSHQRAAQELVTNTHTSVQVIFSNRAAAYLKLEQPQLAMVDCGKSLQITWTPKAAYRHGLAAMQLGQHAEALQSFEMLVQREPRNREAREKASECEEVLRLEHGDEDAAGGEAAML